MPDAIVDTSVLIATEKLGIQNLIAKVYDHIIAPRAVLDEYGKPEIEISVVESPYIGIYRLLHEELNLGRGESAAIALSQETKTTILLDDLRARRIAKELGLRVSGTIGLLLRLEQILAPDFNAYSHAQRLRGIGFRIGDALLETIRRKGV